LVTPVVSIVLAWLIVLPPEKSVSATNGLTVVVDPQSICVPPVLLVVVVVDELLELLLDELELLLLDELLELLVVMVPFPLAVIVNWADGAEKPEALIDVTI